MTYVMSDIHGEYGKYLKMLDKIEFSDEDTLFIIGDTVDRGEEPIELLRDMSVRYNVYPIMGNHELMALEVLKPLATEVSEENAERLIRTGVLEKLQFWMNEGGDTTLKGFRALSNDDRMAIIEYLEEFAPFETVKVNGNRFVLVHAGLGNYSPDKKLSEYSLEELAFMRPEPEDRYFEGQNVTVIVGHTPTVAMWGKHEIYREEGLIDIDCGAAFGGRLACLCLDTMEEFYV